MATTGGPAKNNNGRSTDSGRKESNGEKNPGEEIIWFGRHKKRTFDQFLDSSKVERYMDFIRNQCRLNPSPNVPNSLCSFSRALAANKC